MSRMDFAVAFNYQDPGGFPCRHSMLSQDSMETLEPSVKAVLMSLVIIITSAQSKQRK